MSDFVKVVFIVLLSFVLSSCGLIVAELFYWLKRDSLLIYNLGAGIGTFILSVTAAFTAFFGFRQHQIFILKSRRTDEQRRLRFDLASKAIDLATQAQSEIKRIRHPLDGSLGSLQLLQIPPYTAQDIANIKRNRMITAEQLFAELRSTIPKYRILIGDPSSLQFLCDFFYRSLNLSIFVLEHPKSTHQEINQQLDVINEIHRGGQNPISREIENKAEEIVSVCAPIISNEF